MKAKKPKLPQTERLIPIKCLLPCDTNKEGTLLITKTYTTNGQLLSTMSKVYLPLSCTKNLDPKTKHWIRLYPTYDGHYMLSCMVQVNQDNKLVLDALVYEQINLETNNKENEPDTIIGETNRKLLC